jgi:hypothetical protein
MRVELETRNRAASHAAAQERHREPERRAAPRLPHDRLLTRVAVLPLFLVLAAFEIAWLLLLAYATHRFLLQPILAY